MVWLNEKQFHKHSERIDGLTPTESAAKWAKSLAADIMQKRDDDNQLTLPVRIPDVSSVINGYKEATRYAETSDVEKNQIEGIMAKLLELMKNGQASGLVETLNKSELKPGGAIVVTV